MCHHYVEYLSFCDAAVYFYPVGPASEFCQSSGLDSCVATTSEEEESVHTITTPVQFSRQVLVEDTAFCISRYIIAKKKEASQVKHNFCGIVLHQ